MYLDSGEGIKVILFQEERPFRTLRDKSERVSVGVISCKLLVGRSSCEQGSDICFQEVGTLYQTRGQIHGRDYRDC